MANAIRTQGLTRTGPAIIISLYHQFDVRYAISILGQSEARQNPWREFGDRAVLRLQFDDVQHSTGQFEAPSREQVAALIRFAKEWSGRGSLLAHCRAGASRSPAAALIAAVSLPQIDPGVLARIVYARAYFRPNVRMLEIADQLLGVKPTLIEILRLTSRPDRLDSWAPVRIPLA